MRKKLLILIALISGSYALNAQTSGGPDSYGYVWRNNADAQGPVYNWIEIDGLNETVEVLGLTDDNVVGPFSLPNPFHFYWYDVNNFRVGSNGYITFASNTNIASGANGFPSIPTAGASNNDFIAALMSDLLFTGTPARCYYYISPTNDSLVVTYDSVPFWDQLSGSVGTNTFQIILNNNDSTILFQYKEQVGASAATSGFVSTGIENNSGNIGLQTAFDIYPASGTAVKYYPPATTTLAINDAATVYNNNSENGAIFLSRNGSPYLSESQIKNTGNQTLASFNVYSRVVNSANAIQVRDTVPVTNLAPAQTQFITFPDTWTPTVAAVFRHICETKLTGDATPSNNTITLEMQVVDTTLANIELMYDNATASTGTMSWAGGDGGGAVYIKPSFAPYVLNSVKTFITSDPNAVGYSLMIYDDDGVNGAPLTLLDSVFVAPGSFTLNVFTTTALTNPITKASGGFYILWFMGGDGITLGTTTTIPISNRTYEVLTGSGPANFAAYRERETEELMLRALISKVVGVNEIKKGELFSDIYPNPSTGTKVFIDFDLQGAEKFTVNIYNASGQLVETKIIRSSVGTIEMNTSKLQSGLYFCHINVDGNTTERRFVVSK